MNRSIKSDPMRPEYDFSGGVRGKHVRAYRRGANVVTLEPDVAKVFKNSAAVNRALKSLIELARTQVDGKRARTPRKRS